MKIIELVAENYKKLRVVAIQPDGKRVVMLTGKNGQGKQQPISEPVLTPHGWKPIGTLCIGDDVIGSSGTAVKVTGIFPQTVRDTYRVTMADGASTRCGPEHLWTVSRWGNGCERITETLSTDAIIKAGLRRGASKKWAVPIVCPVQFADSGQELPIDPYVLGVILGDGHIEPTGYATVTSWDAAILDAVEPPDRWRAEHEIGSGFWSRPLRHMELAGKRSWEKFVPPPYLWASAEHRRALLAGLLDTDGTAMDSWASFTSTSEALADGVVHLASSLGYVANKRDGVTKKYRYNGELKEGRPAWQVSIKSKESPFTLARKTEAWSPSEQRGERWRFIDTIERVEDEDSVCIMVDANDGLYVTRDFILTHNTSVLDSLWFALKGQKALPDKKQSIIRNGAERMKVKLNLGECTITRTLGRDGNPPTLTLEVNGKRAKTPQDFLDDLFNSLTFDPLEFIHMSPKEQVAELRKTAKIDLDFEAIAAKNEEDYKERHTTKKQADEIEAQMKGLTVLQGLPKEKLDEEGILGKLEEAGELNRKAQEIFQAKQDLGVKAAELGLKKNQARDRQGAQQKTIELLKKELAAAEAKLATLATEEEEITAQWTQAEAAFRTAPAGEPIDVAALTAELQSVQRTNRAIDTRTEWEALQKKLDVKQRQAEDLTRRMEAREEKKRTAVANAKIPVEGLTFDELEVKYNGILLENLGEGEQIRISTLIAMAGNPKLRVLCIRRGEALDEEGLKVIAQLAEQHDFQVWMARVDSSGKVGLVLEDGMIVARNETEEKEVHG